MSCCPGKCYEFTNAAGVTDYINVFREDAAVKFTQASDASKEIKPIADAPAEFDIETAKQVDCSAYNSASAGDEFLGGYSEVDADGKKTGVDLLLFMKPDGSTYYQEVGAAAGTEYVFPDGNSAEKTEDVDWIVSNGEFWCDGGVTVRVDRTYKDGDLASEKITNATTGADHTFSGSQKASACGDLKNVTIEWGHCFIPADDDLADAIPGGIESTIDMSLTPPAVSAMRWVSTNDAGEIIELPKADYKKLASGCCN